MRMLRKQHQPFQRARFGQRGPGRVREYGCRQDNEAHGSPNSQILTDQLRKPFSSRLSVRSMIPPMRNSASNLDAMALAGLPLLCMFCCMCGLISLLVFYFVWAINTIVASPEVPTTTCGAHYNIWVFCLTVMIIIPILGCITSIIATISRTPGLQAIPPLINLAMAVWGMALWAHMSDSCQVFFDTNYSDLVLLFHINVVLLAFSLLVFVCVICLGFAFLGGAMATGGLGGRQGYSAVPGGASGGQDEELLNASEHGLSGEVERLLREGANVNARDSRGWSALHRAADKGHVDTAKELINAGAEIDAEAENGDTPLKLAIGKGDIEHFLRQVGAKEPGASAV